MSLNIVLVEPEIPFNTGAIARTCGLTHTNLHLIKPLGFSVDDKHLKRAGLDYWNLVSISYYDCLDDFFNTIGDANFFLATTKTNQKYSDVNYSDGDYIIFGKETKGLPESLIYDNKEKAIKIPMLKDYGRSLNLANSANIILYEALRQINFLDLE